MVNIEQYNNTLTVSYVDKDGNIQLTNIDVPKKEMFEWVYSNKSGSTEMKSWNNKPIKKQPAKKLNKYRLIEFLSTQSQELQDTIFSKNIPKKYFIDIETEVLDEFPNPENPKSQIYSIAISNEKDQILVLSIKDLEQGSKDRISKNLNEYFSKYNKNITFSFQYFESEYDMLYTFFNRYAKQMACLTGWNFVSFDWNYLQARSKKFNIDVGSCSPTGKMINFRVTKFNGDIENIPIPIHKIVVDYLEVYKKWDMTVKTKESDKLDYVAEAVLGLNKIQYSGSLEDLYRDNFETFIYYNAVDAYLVKMIDEKINSIMPYFSLAYFTRVEHQKAFSPIAMIENIMSMELLKENKVLIREEKDRNHEKFDGAFVLACQPGFHNDLITFDYASLYPTTIRQYNISPEVYLGKGEIEGDNHIKCASGANFKKDEIGVLPTVLSKLYQDRKNHKKAYLEIESELNYLKDILKTKKLAE